MHQCFVSYPFHLPHKTSATLIHTIHLLHWQPSHHHLPAVCSKSKSPYRLSVTACCPLAVAHCTPHWLLRTIACRHSTKPVACFPLPIACCMLYWLRFKHLTQDKHMAFLTGWEKYGNNWIKLLKLSVHMHQCK